MTLEGSMQAGSVAVAGWVPLGPTLNSYEQRRHSQRLAEYVS